MEIYLRTKKVDSYFCGKLVFYCDEWMINPIHGANGRVTFLEITEWRTKTTKEIYTEFQNSKGIKS